MREEEIGEAADARGDRHLRGARLPPRRGQPRRMGVRRWRILRQPLR